MNRRGKIKYVLRTKVKTRHLKPSYILKKLRFSAAKKTFGESRMKSVLIAKSIRKNLKYLRKYTKNSKNSKSETAAWICDNFYTAEQSGKSAAEFFKKRFRLSDEIFDICKKEIQEQQNDREQDIEKLLIKGLCSKSEWFDCQSLTALPPFSPHLQLI